MGAPEQRKITISKMIKALIQKNDVQKDKQHDFNCTVRTDQGGELVGSKDFQNIISILGYNLKKYSSGIFITKWSNGEDKSNNSRNYEDYTSQSRTIFTVLEQCPNTYSVGQKQTPACALQLQIYPIYRNDGEETKFIKVESVWQPSQSGKINKKRCQSRSQFI